MENMAVDHQAADVLKNAFKQKRLNLRKSRTWESQNSRQKFTIPVKRMKSCQFNRHVHGFGSASSTDSSDIDMSGGDDYVVQSSTSPLLISATRALTGSLARTSQDTKQVLTRKGLIEVKDKLEYALMSSQIFQSDIIHLSMDQCSKKVDLIMDKRRKPEAEQLHELLGANITHVNLKWQSRTSSKIDHCFYLKEKVECGTMLEIPKDDTTVIGAIGAILKDVRSDDLFAVTCMHIIDDSDGQQVSKDQPLLFKYDLEGNYQVVLKKQQTKFISNRCYGLRGSWRTTVKNLPGPVNIATDIAVLRLLNPDVNPNDTVTHFMDEHGQTAKFVLPPDISTTKLNKLYAAEHVEKFGPVTGWRRGIIDDMSVIQDSKTGYILVSDTGQHGVFGERGDSGAAILSVLKQPEYNIGSTEEVQQQKALPSSQCTNVSSVSSAEGSSDEDPEVPDNTAFGSFLGNVTVRETQKHLVTNWRHQLRAVEEVFGLQLVLLN